MARTRLNGSVLIYSGDEAIGKVSRKHAITMLHRRVARIRRVREGETIGPYGLPESLSLIREIDAEVYSRTGTVPYSRSGLFIRDRGICAYCLRPGDTMDHIMPKSRGGQAEWTNAVVACLTCNQRKADLTPDEAGMPLLRVPFAPTYLDIHDPL